MTAARQRTLVKMNYLGKISLEPHSLKFRAIAFGFSEKLFHFINFPFMEENLMFDWSNILKCLIYYEIPAIFYPQTINYLNSQLFLFLHYKIICSIFRLNKKLGSLPAKKSSHFYNYSSSLPPLQWILYKKIHIFIPISFSWYHLLEVLKIIKYFIYFYYFSSIFL